MENLKIENEANSNETKKDQIIYASLLILTLLICSLISYYRFLSIELKNSIHYNDGYLTYSQSLKNWILTKENSFIKSDWFQNYDKKNRILIPLLVAILSIITHFSITTAGLIINYCFFLLFLGIFFLTFLKETKIINIIKGLILLISINTVTTNIIRFSTDIAQIALIFCAFYYLKKVKRQEKILLNYILCFFFIFLALLARESSILFVLAIILDFFKKWYHFLLFFFIGLIGLVLSYFIPIGDYNLLAIILDTIFTTTTAQQLSQGILVEYHLTKFWEVKTSSYFFYYFGSSLVFAFFIYGFFAIFPLVNLFSKKKEKRQFKFEFIWIFLYLAFLTFIYSGRILDRFLLPVIPFFIMPSLKGFSILTQIIQDFKIKHNKSRILHILHTNPNVYYSLAIFCNFLITAIRMIFSSY